MAKEYHCTNCGKVGSVSSIGGPPSHWKTVPFSSKMFCSSKCKDEFNDRKSSSKSSSDSFFSFDDDNSKKSKKEKKKEQKVAKLQEQKEKEAYEKDKEKGRQLKIAGKKWLGLWYLSGKSGRIGIGGYTGMTFLTGLLMVGEKTGFGLIFIGLGSIGLVFLFLVAKDYFKK